PYPGPGSAPRGIGGPVAGDQRAESTVAIGRTDRQGVDGWRIDVLAPRRRTGGTTVKHSIHGGAGRAASLLLALSALSTAADKPAEDAERGVRAVLDAQIQAWNRGDLNGSRAAS